MERIILTLTENHPGWKADKKTAANAKFRVTERTSACFLVELDEHGARVKFQESDPGEILFPWGVIADIEYPGNVDSAVKKATPKPTK